jgi:hypothetical protein
VPATARYQARGPDHITTRGKFGRIKNVMKYLFNSSPGLAVACEELLRVTPESGELRQALVTGCLL